MRGLYVHIPFCVRKCAYCDFYSVPGHSALIDPYIAAVLTEASAHAGLSFHTLYLGGGTPSLLEPRGLTKLIDGLRHILDISGLIEATIEVNPDSATSELFKTAIDIGISRVSIGVQSLSNHELRSLGRIHTAEQSVAVINQAKRTGFSKISADVIVGTPGQDWASLRTTLETLTSLGISHLSVYCLSLEQGTPLAINPPQDLPSDDMQAELFDQARFLLEKRGFIHYEISNFAISGHECQHNLNYWRGGEYLGLGATASSHLNNRRFKNRSSLDAYLENPVGLAEDVEELDTREKANEEAMLRLRLIVEGVSASGLIQRFGRENTQELVQRLNDMAAEGMLTSDGLRYRLASSRVLTSNPVFARVLGY